MAFYEPNFGRNTAVLPYCEKRILNAQEKGFKTNVHYLANYRQFIRWFDEHEAAFSLMVVEDGNEIEATTQRLETYVNRQGTVYITQYNVETYFELVVCYLPRNTMAGLRRKVSALNWFLQHVEDRTAEPIVYSSSIVQSMTEQQALNSVHISSTNACSDPHRGLKDIFSEEEIVRLVTSCWERPDSLDILFSYTWGKNAGVRGASSRAMVLCDLNLSYSYGPELYAPRNRTLLLVLRRGPVHKDKHTTDKQVGVQRHRDYRQCSVFCTGVLLITRLRNLAYGINFLRTNSTSRVLWWDIPINKYTTYSAESNAMRQVLASANLDVYGGKVTHHRTQAVQTAGSRGLQPWQVCSFTKHIVDKLHSTYLPECEEESMKVMSGFRKNETRFVPNEHIVFSGTHSTYLELGIKFLIPHYDRYVREYHSANGDKSQAATKLLFHVIPYLVETVLQCGMYFIHDFPTHEFAGVLRVSTVP